MSARAWAGRAPVMTMTFPSMLLLMILALACHNGLSETGPFLQGLGISRPLDRDL